MPVYMGMAHGGWMTMLSMLHVCVFYSPTEHLTDAWDPCPQTNEQQQKKELPILHVTSNHCTVVFTLP